MSVDTPDELDLAPLGSGPLEPEEPPPPYPAWRVEELARKYGGPEQYWPAEDED